ncbi:MAG TPA: hypothetical protein DDY91_01365 [Planctomycetaceae bacterium]|nr:hypothetical protein [Planctomycetaceae bacterium]
MHYLSETSRRTLEEGAGGPGAGAELEQSHHWQSAPLYFLTLLVGGLLLADSLLTAVGTPEWLAWRSPAGFRLSLLAAVLGGARIVFQTLDGLFQGRIGADLALSIACLAAILLGEHTVAALVVFIALLGESLEGYTVDRAFQAIRRAFDLYPRLAHRLRDGQEEDVPLAELQRDDLVLVRPGERIPADGTIREGTTSIDQGPLTGESLPVERTVGDTVFAGTLNQFSAITVEVNRLGNETAVGQIAAVVQQAGRRQAPLEREADRLARLFLPAVLAAATLTLLGWRYRAGNWSAGWLPALSVLVVACPCALILATPSAFVAALSWLARMGVVVKGSAALERLASVDTIAFDKTGTLTTGELQLTTGISPQLSHAELLGLTAIATRGSGHPVSRVVTAAADREGLVIPLIPGLTEFPGLGLQLPLAGTHWPRAVSPPPPEGARLVVGNLRWLTAQGVLIDDAWEQTRLELEDRGESPLGVAWVSPAPAPLPGAMESPSPTPTQGVGQLVGLWGIADTPRPAAQQVVRQLRDMGPLQLALLTGDRASNTRGLLKHLGPLDDSQSELLPQEKRDWIQARQQSGHRVAMIGDGINDALALDKADVGIAIARAGNDLAAAAGDIVLLGDPLTTLPSLLRLSRELVQTIRRSILIFAFGVNTLGVLLSAWGWFSPVVSALFHEAGSLAVMLYALRLLWFEPGSTSRVVGWRQNLEATAERLSRWLSPNEWIFFLLRNRRKILPLLGCLLGAGWMVSNLTLIRSDEQAVVTRFGRFQELLAPGLAWRWPWPLETVQREQVARLRPVQLGFRSVAPAIRSGPGSYRAPVEWQTTHEDLGYLTLADENLLLTGDELLLELTAEGQFQLTNLRDYLGGSTSPEATLRAVLESAIREIVASRPLETLLGESRTTVEQSCLQLARQELAKHRLGLELQTLHLLDVHPPGGVVPAYRDVANALEEREQLRNLAQTNAARTLLSVVGETAADALHLVVRPSRDMQRNDVGEQRADAVDPPEEAALDWKLDEPGWQRLTADAPTGGDLSGQVSVRLQAARAKSSQATNKARGQRDRFRPLVSPHQAAPQLTQSYLYWNSIEASLANRPLLILDPAAQGRRQFWLPAEGSPPVPPAPPTVIPTLSRPEPTNDDQ